MDKQRLLIELVAIEKEYESAKKCIIRQYCNTNNPYKVGDIFTDHIGSVKIESIGYYYHKNEPCCIYIGPELKKNGEPRKDGSIRQAWQSNEVKP